MIFKNLLSTWRKGLWVPAVALALTLSLAAPGVSAAAQDKGTTHERSAMDTGNWQQQAADTFYLNSDMAGRVMTQKDWQEHSERMKGMSPEERSQYRTEWHRKLMDEARERGMNVPDMPADHGRNFHEKAGTT